MANQQASVKYLQALESGSIETIKEELRLLNTVPSNNSDVIPYTTLILGVTCNKEQRTNTLHHLASLGNCNMLADVLSLACDDSCTYGYHSDSCKTRQVSMLLSLDKKEATPLYHAIQSGHYDMCSFLCTIPTVKDSLNKHKDKDNFYAVNIALMSKQLSICTLLINNGAKLDVTSGNLGETVLHKYIRDESIDVIQYALTQKSSILQQKDQSKNVPFFAALRNYRMEKHPERKRSFLEVLFDTSYHAFPKEFRRAITTKNDLQHTLFVEALDRIDIYSVDVLMKLFMNEKNEDARRGLIGELFTEVDYAGSNIIHIAAQASLFSAINSADSNDTTGWMWPLERVYDIAESMDMELSRLTILFGAKDMYDLTPSALLDSILERVYNDIDKKTDETEKQKQQEKHKFGAMAKNIINDSLIEVEKLWSGNEKRSVVNHWKEPTRKMAMREPTHMAEILLELFGLYKSSFE